MTQYTRSQFLRQLALGCGAALLFTACNSQPTNTATSGTSSGTGAGKTLKVGTEPAFAPFEFQGQNGQLEGFDIDLMKAIGKEAGLEVQFQSLPFDGLIPALQAGPVDAAISAMTITAERQKTVTFSHPYFKAGLAIAVAANNQAIANLDSLKDKKIAVQIGTTGADKAKTIPGTKVSTFDSAPLALQELSNGNVDAVINDAPVTLYAISKGNLTGIKVIGQLLTEEYYGIAMPKNSANAETLNQALGKVIQNGTYAELYKKWFKSEPPTLPETPPSK